MVTVLRLLFGVSALVFFFITGIFAGKWVMRRLNDSHPGRIMNVAYFVNTMLVAVLFTLWCVRAGML